MLPVVALVGRPNVGKSTLFNCITRSQKSLVNDRPGVTRDRIYGRSKIFDHPFIIVDTGGIGYDDDSLQGFVESQVEQILQEADKIIFVTDFTAGITQLDREIAQSLRESQKDCIIAVNKTEGRERQLAVAEFHELGFETIVAISATKRAGMAQLYSALALPIPVDDELQSLDEIIRVALIGRPNAGKSTLVNRLAHEERVIVSPEPGTTRDSIEVALRWELEGVEYNDYLFFDTAGVRKRNKISDDVERLSVVKTIQSLESAQVAILMLDASSEVSEQDVTLAGMIEDSGRSIIVALNKWDGLDSYQKKRMLSEVSRKLEFLPVHKVVTISAQYGTGFKELMTAVNNAHTAAFTKMSTGKLNRVIKEAMQHQSPPWKGQRPSKIKYVHQGGKNPPRVLLHGNSLEHLPESYLRYLSNAIQLEYRLIGTRVVIELRNSDNPYDRNNSKSDNHR